jgi:hypothetical protein
MSTSRADAPIVTGELALASDPLTVLAETVDESVTAAEAGYIRAVRAANTLRGYRSDCPGPLRRAGDSQQDVASDANIARFQLQPLVEPQPSQT